jgi:hypothetical protein
MKPQTQNLKSQNLWQLLPYKRKVKQFRGGLLMPDFGLAFRQMFQVVPSSLERGSLTCSLSFAVASARGILRAPPKGVSSCSAAAIPRSSLPPNFKEVPLLRFRLLSRWAAGMPRHLEIAWEILESPQNPVVVSDPRVFSLKLPIVNT